jgi:hypothetical protein
MSYTANQETVANDLDAAHARAKERYRALDLSGFMAIFAPSLRYKQPDGRTIGWEQLAHDVSAQFTALDKADTSYNRESLHLDSTGATEVLQQTATLTMRSWLFFKRRFNLTRRGRYHWVRTDAGWQIDEVEILNESVGRGAA